MLCFSWNTAKAQDAGKTLLHSRLYTLELTKTRAVLTRNPRPREGAARPTRPKNTARLMRYIDRIDRECRLSADNDCARVLFKLADADLDGRLTRPETVAFVENAFVMAGKTDRARNAARARVEGNAIFDDLLACCAPHGTVGFDDIIDNFTLPDRPVVRETIGKIGNIIPGLSLAGKIIR